MFICKCNPTKEFTCANGDCISLEKRCNERTDCNDESDEYHCQQIIIDKNSYRKTYVPRNPTKEGPLKIEVGFDVIDIVEINEAEVQCNYFLFVHDILFFKSFLL